MFIRKWRVKPEGKEGQIMFGKKKREPIFDRQNQKPVIRSSICTGEQVAGFKDVNTGKFTEIMVIHGEKDMSEFLKKYNLVKTDITKEW